MVTETMKRPVSAFVVPAEDSDDAIRFRVLEAFDRAERETDSRNWLLGRAAAEWKSRSEDRTDAGFAEFCGGPVSADVVQKSRRVWEEFGGESCATLREAAGVRWSHFFAALSLRAVGESPAVGVEWAIENPRTTAKGESVAASVAELRTWIRIQAVGRGVELVEDDDDGGRPAVGEGAGSGDSRTAEAATDADEQAVERNEGRDPAEYAPFRSDAGKPREVDHDVDRTKLAPERGKKSAKQKRVALLLDRIGRDFRSLLKMDCGDIARDHADALAEQQRQGEKLDKVVGLCKQTRAALLRELEG